MARRLPAHLSIPVDVQQAPIETEWQPVSSALTHPRFVDEAALDRLVDLLSGPDAARNVVLLAGPGVLHADATGALTKVAERFDLPVATTLSGKGLMSEEHPLALGVFGYGGSRAERASPTEPRSATTRASRRCCRRWLPAASVCCVKQSTARRRRRRTVRDRLCGSQQERTPTFTAPSRTRGSAR